jgi:phage-related minor tail protein
VATNKRIQGITIEIGGETTGLQKALADVNKRSNSLKSELKDVERLLKFDPGNAEALAQKQKLLADQVENTTERLEMLRKAEKQVQDQVKKGDISEKQYRDFRREIEFTEGSLKNLRQQLSKVNDGAPMKELKKDADKANDSAKELGGTLEGLAGALVAGGGIGSAIENALDTSSLNTKIDINFDVPEESKQSIKDAIREIQAYGIDGIEALEGVRRQWALNADAGDKANLAIVKSASAIVSAYSGIDFTELIQETNEIASTLGIFQTQAIGLTNALLKVGFPPEQLDIIAEYGQQLHDAGYNASEIQAIMAAGVETGTWNIDSLLDGLKEGRIRVAEFGFLVPEALSDIIEGTDLSASQFMEWGKAVASGGENGKKAMQDIALALKNVEDDTTRNALGVQIFGTMWEDQGTNITDTLLGMNDHLTTAVENQESLNDSISRLDADPAVQFQQAMMDLKTALEPVLLFIADLISKVAVWISENPKLAATITAIVTTLGILMGILLALSPIFTAMATLAGALGVSVGAIAAPVLIVIGVITALIAIGAALWKNWDTIQDKAGKMVSKLVSKIMDLKRNFTVVFEAIKNLVKQKIADIIGFFANLGDKLKINIPKPKLPHFSVSGKFDLMPPDISVPKLSVKWYKDGGLFPANSPRLVGMGDANVPEAALPLSDKVLGMIANMISDRMGGAGQSMVIQPAPVYLDNTLVGEVLFNTIDNRFNSNAETALYMRGERRR